MKNGFKSKNFTIAISTFVLFAVLFFCQGGSLNRIFMNMSMDMNMSHHECCDIENSTGALTEHVLFVLPSENTFSLTLLLLSAGLAFLLSNIGREKYIDKFFAYVHSQDRGGGSVLFKYFNLLFRKGILHPKTF